jgi:signal peptidase I
LLVRTFLIQQVKVSGTSMEPALIDNQHLFIEKVSYKIKGVKRYDIIVFQPYPDNDELFYIKRVIGLPGEKVRIENNTIYINGEKLHEGYGGNTYTDAKLAKLGILVGAELSFVNDTTIKVIVSDERGTVVYKGEEWSLSGLARALLHKTNKLNGAKYFTYNGETIWSLRNRLEDI